MLPVFSFFFNFLDHYIRFVLKSFLKSIINFTAGYQSELLVFIVVIFTTARRDLTKLFLMALGFVFLQVYFTQLYIYKDIHFISQ